MDRTLYIMNLNVMDRTWYIMNLRFMYMNIQVHEHSMYTTNVPVHYECAHLCRLDHCFKCSCNINLNTVRDGRFLSSSRSEVLCFKNSSAVLCPSLNTVDQGLKKFAQKLKIQVQVRFRILYSISQKCTFDFQGPAVDIVKYLKLEWKQR